MNLSLCSNVLTERIGQEEFDRIRPLSYKDTDIFMLCFAVDNERSIKNITSKVCYFSI